jgi:hypothetical protein
MSHHPYFVTGETEEGIVRAQNYVHEVYGMKVVANPDVLVLRHGLLSVDDARRLLRHAELSPTVGERKVLIVSASRLFHEAQNALLKLFEEPPESVLLILIIPSEGMLLPTLRSRLLSLPLLLQSGEVGSTAQQNSVSILLAQDFLVAESAAREKMLAKILDRTKSDKEEEKQAARLAALQLFEGLTQCAYKKWREEKNEGARSELQKFLEDMNRFVPVLHERSAPLKLMFEHLQLVVPSTLSS